MTQENVELLSQIFGKQEKNYLIFKILLYFRGSLKAWLYLEIIILRGRV